MRSSFCFKNTKAQIPLVNEESFWKNNLKEIPTFWGHNKKIIMCFVLGLLKRSIFSERPHFLPKKGFNFWYKAYVLQFRYLFPVKKDLWYRHKIKQNYYFTIVPQKTGIFLIMSFENDTSLTGVILFWSPTNFLKKVPVGKY